MKKRNIIISICLIMSITFIAFIPSLKNSFTNWDDTVYITENVLIKSLSWYNIKQIFKTTTFVAYNYHPLTILSYALEYKYFKANPSIYHFTNLLLHLLNSFLVFWIIFILSKKISVSFIVSLLFGIHPLHVESVAWISGRKDVLYTFFFLISIICYLYYLKNKNIKYYFTSLFIFTLSVLSKSMAVTLPIVLLLCDYFFHRKFNKNTLLEKIPFGAISLITGIIAIFSQRTLEREPTTIFNNIINASNGFIFYLIKLIAPFRLSAIYLQPHKIGGIITYISMLSPIIILALFLKIYLSHKHDRNVIFGSMFFLITILPVIQLIPIGKAVPADRYTYVPSIGLFYIFADKLSLIIYKKTKYSKTVNLGPIILLISLIVLFSLLTWNRCKVWKNSITLWSSAIKNYPNIALVYNNRGNAYAKRKKYKKAISDYNEAIRIKPNYVKAYISRGNLYDDIGKYDEAISDFTQAIRIKPDNPRSYLNRGNIYFYKEEYKKAIDDLGQAIKINPKFVKAYNNRGIIYYIKGEYNKAISDLNKAININPYYAKTYNDRGRVYSETKEYEKAISDFNQAIMIDPSFAEAYYNRGILYADKEEYRKAIYDINTAIKIYPYFIDAYYSRSYIYSMINEHNKAWQDIQKIKSLGHEIDPIFLEELKKSSERQQ